MWRTEWSEMRRDARREREIPSQTRASEEQQKDESPGRHTHSRSHKRLTTQIPIRTHRVLTIKAGGCAAPIQRCMHPENHARLSMRTCIHMPGICERPVTRCANEIAVTPYTHHPACDACMCAPTTQRTFGEGTQSSGYRR